MLSPWKFMLFLASALVPTYLLFFLPSSSKSAPLQPRTSPCPGFEGNSDFYGLGIRLGVYLQWFSSWFANTVHPAAAGQNHDANSIFLSAILVALTVTTTNGSVEPVEAYIMIMICFGFVFTVLSVFGIRIFFLRPGSLSIFVVALLDKVKGFEGNTENSRPSENGLNIWPFPWVTFLDNLRTAQLRQDLGPIFFQDLLTGLFKSSEVRPVEFKDVDFMRYPSLSWSGTVWRTTTLTYLHAFAMWLWWSWVPHYDNGQVELCHSQVYFFGRRPLDSGLVIFYKAGTTTMSIFVLVIAVLVLGGARAAVTELLWNALIKMITEKLPTTGPERQFLARLKEVFDLFLNFGYSVTIATTSKLLSLLLADKADRPDVKEMAKLLMRPDDDLQRASASGQSHLPHAIRICTCYHALVLAMMCCFIVFIEKTITAANISGVYSIKNTGQLIPFIIGVASTVKLCIDVITISWLNHKKQPSACQEIEVTRERAIIPGCLI